MLEENDEFEDFLDDEDDFFDDDDGYDGDGFPMLRAA